MNQVISQPLAHIPNCKVSGRLIPAYAFLPRLTKLCVSLGFNDPVVTRSGDTTGDLAGLLWPGAGTLGGGRAAPDHVIILSAKLAYKQEWGGYNGLPGLQFQLLGGTEPSVTPADFIVPYLRQYHFAQTHIHLGCDSTGKPVITLPEALVCGQFRAGGVGLQVDLARIAEPSASRQRRQTSAGTLVSYPLAAQFVQSLANQELFRQPGVFSPIGEHLVPELFSFTGETWRTESAPFPDILALMPWIVAHKTPHLAATLVQLRTGFSRVCQAFAATGEADMRNLICVAGLEIDMRGFRGRHERYYVPWQACWKRHGFSYGNIYPLLQDDLFVALMHCRRPEVEAE